MIRTTLAATAVALTSLTLVPGPASAAPCVKQLAYCVGDELPCLTLDVPPRFVPCP